MAASMRMFTMVIRARGNRLVTSRLTSFSLTSNAKCMFQDIGFKSRISRPCFSLTNDGIEKKNVNYVIVNLVGRREIHRNHYGDAKPGRLTETVYTDEDAEVHNIICRLLVGKGGQNLKRLRSEAGIHFHLDTTRKAYLLVSVTSDGEFEVLKNTKEKLTEEVQRIRNQLMETVSTDENPDIHNEICKWVVGKGGQNIKRLRSEVGIDFLLANTSRAYLLVGVADAKMLKSATEKVTEEVQRIRSLVEIVSTDENVDVHNVIYGSLVGKGGHNLNRLQLEAGIDFQLDNTYTRTAVSVYVTNAEVLQIAVQKVTLEAQRIRNLMETVLTDENAVVHQEIYGHLIGKDGQNLKRLQSEAGINFQLDSIRKAVVVFVTNAAVLKGASEKVTEDIQRIRNLMEKVSTDENADVHYIICRHLIGKDGHNIKRLQSETEIDFRLEDTGTALLVSGASDLEELKNAVEKVTQEVQRIRMFETS